MDQSGLGNARGGVTEAFPDVSSDEGLQDRLAPAFPPSPLFDLGQLSVDWEEKTGTLWTFMTPEGRPSFNRGMLRDFETWQSEISRLFGNGSHDLRYLVLGSRFPGVWNFGGDLGLFAKFIRNSDRQSLVDYGRVCVNILHRNMNSLGLPMVTIGLVQGQALGGGFEALLSFNVIIAERSAKFGLPEIAFGLFPGMGAHALLIRQLGQARAERLILSGNTYSAEELHDMGLVDMVVDDGEGVSAVEDFIRVNSRKHAGSCAVYKASREVSPVSLDELNRIVEIWADTALKLQEKDLRLMERLVAAQSKLSQSISVD
ncbi:MAG: crotonase/enoyl-CoA hydratase family protein [Parasphingopyxis sp.]|uniref:crotonase/enoyl-CoA hydratase family protein n=1 Tax=Parasphingopyxis sp. TaxID=1920299 RepID=UPI002629689F|nr:crotonase/enoyl-CoA hydratase family protein [uncultured Parasphingopyxis sp.]